MFGNYKLILYVVLAVIIGGAIIATQAKIRSVEKDRDRVILEKQTLLTQISQQNAAIADLQAKGKQKELELRNVEAAAENQRLADEKEIDKIMAADVSKECHSAVKWAATTGAAIAKSWN